MKKLFTLAAALLVVASVSAQRGPSAYGDATVNKRGIALLPTCGDFAIGMDATPFFRYAGNMFNNSEFNLPPFAASVDRVTIYGKYFVQPDRAIRAAVSLNFGQETNNEDVPPTIDKIKESNFGITLIGGYEWRRGHGRVQGFYGAEGRIFFDSETTKYEYVDAMSSGVAERTIKEKSSPEFGIGAAGFVGVEYFFAPKISLGAEFNLAFDVAFSGKSKVETEAWDVDNDRVVKNTVKGKSSTDFNLRTNPTGRLFVMFHF